MTTPKILSLPYVFALSAILLCSGCNPPAVKVMEKAVSVTPAVEPHGEPMQLVFQDEFNGDALDLNVWKSKEYDEDPVKNDTVRGPDNLEVKDGHLLLHVRKEARERKGRKSSWTAAYVYMREPVDNNVYIEARFKPTDASGVNNAFWLSSVTADRKSYRDRYEVDCPETRLDITAGPNTGRAHLAWHDWKTQSYIKDAKDKDGHIAQGTHVKHEWDAYNTWGVWIGEDEAIYYLNGKEVWNGKTHAKLGNQWFTGVGKFDRWFPDEEKRAYGKFGQPNWNYQGGYAGDKMNIILATIPWDAEWSPLSDAADGTYMAVDYVRMFKPARVLETSPVQAVDMGAAVEKLSLSGPARPAGEGIQLGGGATVSWPLEPAVSRAAQNPTYMSFIIQKEGAGSVDISLLDEAGAPLVRLGVDEANALRAGGQTLASTATAYPANETGQPFFSENRKYLLVARLTPGRDGSSSAVSLSAYNLVDGSVPDKEPYFYANIDEQGNTSINNGWQINQRDAVEAGGLATKVSVAYEGEGEVLVENFKTGRSFRSVLP
jgi:hypothetical protein